MLNEFKKFISRGNVIDLAVGVIIGTAFTAIVTSLVNDIIMPPIGMITGGIDFSEYFFDLSQSGYATLEEANKAGAPVIRYGEFVNVLIRFLLVAFSVFMLIRGINKLSINTSAAAAAPSKSEVLLTEIRDLLQQQSDKPKA